ncbi:MAG: MDR family MFS transporter [Anaerolineae bacterium]
MVARVRLATSGYTRQFWLLFWGTLINSIGGSMVWPFLTVYMRQHLAVPLTAITLLFTLNSAAGLVATSIAGPAVDRFGRKIAMTLSLAGSCVVYGAMAAAHTLPAWAALMTGLGVIWPLYRVGADAMVADMIEPARRPAAYALLRVVSNLGIAVGPMIGGFLSTLSYAYAFAAGATANFLFLVLILAAVRETLPPRRPEERSAHDDGGYGPVLRDLPFVVFCAVYVVATMPSSIMMTLLAVYAKENFGVPESRYGFIMATNALMVVLFQYAVTRRAERHRPLRVLTAGALLYAAGVGSVALGRSFPAFVLSMAILTAGELLLVPTATALAANLAPAEMRGRYMGLFGMTWGIGFGIAPVIGGVLSDRVAPIAPWYGGLALGLSAAAGFLLLGRWSALSARGRQAFTSPQ